MLFFLSNFYQFFDKFMQCILVIFIPPFFFHLNKVFIYFYIPTTVSLLSSPVPCSIPLPTTYLSLHHLAILKNRLLSSKATKKRWLRGKIDFKAREMTQLVWLLGANSDHPGTQEWRKALSAAHCPLYMVMCITAHMKMHSHTYAC